MARRSPAASPTALIWVGLIAALALVLAWVWNSSLGEPGDPQTNAGARGPATPDATETSPEAAAPTDALAGAEQQRQAAALENGPVDDETFGWQGVVRDEQGHPVPGVALRWATVWNGSGQVEFSAGEELQLSLDATGYQAKLMPLGDVLIPGSTVTRRVELQRGREIHLQIQPIEAVEDGRFAGIRVLNADGDEIPDYPISYRTIPGKVFLYSAPRQALQVHFVRRGTRDTWFFVEVPRQEGESEEPTLVQARWPDQDEGGRDER